MLPDYIIYDELRRREMPEHPERPRPQLEVPTYVPYLPDSEKDEESDEEEAERGVIIIQM